MIETVKRLSKEDTNGKHLNNLRLVRQRPDESSAFAEMSAKLQRVLDVGGAEGIKSGGRPEAMKRVRWVGL